jgi:hypothetical protein
MVGGQRQFDMTSRRKLLLAGFGIAFAVIQFLEPTRTNPPIV